MDGRYDIAIIGTGPAGISAAITAKVRNKKFLLLGSAFLSDKVTKAHRIQNYPGLPDIPGAELAEKLQEHLRVMDIAITDCRVNMVYAMGSYYSLQIGQDFAEASSVILASGVSFGKMLPGEDENLGRGVSYCATCDAALYKGKEAVVVGYAPKEEADAVFLAELADKVTYIPVYGKEESGPVVSQRISENPKIDVKYTKPESIEKKDGKMVLHTGLGEMVSDGIFLLRESVAPDRLVPGLEVEDRHVKVDRKMATNLPGLFAAGDITGTPYQYVKAAGEGNTAALSAVSYVDVLSRGK